MINKSTITYLLCLVLSIAAGALLQTALLNCSTKALSDGFKRILISNMVLGVDDHHATRKPAGKRPTLRPLEEVPPNRVLKRPPTTPLSAPGRLQSRKQTKFKSSTTHGMMTRRKARDRPFRLRDLPAEVRNNVYYYTFNNPTTRKTMPLSNVTQELPDLLSVSRDVRGEALPIYFASTIFTVQVRSNWCVRNKHYHGSEYLYWDEAGLIDIPDVLLKGSSTLPKEAMRMRRVDFEVTCACCEEAVELASLRLSVEGRKPEMLYYTHIKQAEAQLAFRDMFAEVQVLIDEMGMRDAFNGFTIEDVLLVAECFRSNLADNEAFAANTLRM